ncbi:MAG: hypothetical protein GKR97_07615 [Rhizobiaceae bacterium]|nr:hypothetical protein [Rhizobiaceae bacterium]
MFPFRFRASNKDKNRKSALLRSMSGVDMADIGLKPADVERLVDKLRLLDQ